MSLLAISPLDGRYASKLEALKPCFSEYALIACRVKVEVAWLLSLESAGLVKHLGALDAEAREKLLRISEQFDEVAAAKIKAIETQTNHDVKAVEYWLQERLSQEPDLNFLVPFIHFACTSEDINNLAYALMLKSGREVLMPYLRSLADGLVASAHRYADAAMLSRTHGQAATPTTMGKEVANFAYRLQQAICDLEAVRLLGKCNGAVGNYNAHQFAYPDYDWQGHSQSFVRSLGLGFSAYTTQIEPHDMIGRLCHALAQTNTILLDLSRDVWLYISSGFFKQKCVEGEVGSSTMPHKVNPIDFENAEGNLGLSNVLLQFFAEKLPVSRWQRDLSDSTVMRSLGVAFGHALLAYQSMARGIAKLSLDEMALRSDLDQHWEVLAEAVQTVLRKYGVSDAYERLKAFSRGRAVLSQQDLVAFVQEQPLPLEAKQALCSLSPDTYLGNAADQARALQALK